MQRATKAESAWRSREKKLLDELEAARWRRGTKRPAPEPVAVQEGVAEDKAWLTQCAIELRTGLQQAVTAMALLEDSLKGVDTEEVPPPSSAEALDQLLKTYPVGDIPQHPRKEQLRPEPQRRGRNGLRDSGSVEVTGGDRMVMVLVSDGDGMVMLLVEDGDRVVTVLPGDGDRMVMVLVQHADQMVMVLVGDCDRMLIV